MMLYMNMYIYTVLFLKAENDPLHSELQTPLDFNSSVRCTV